MLFSILKTIIRIISFGRVIVSVSFFSYFHPIFFINIPVLITCLMSRLGRGGVENAASIILKYLQDFTIAQTLKICLKYFSFILIFSFLFYGSESSSARLLLTTVQNKCCFFTFSPPSFPTTFSHSFVAFILI
jgi:hypothetical protein